MSHKNSSYQHLYFNKTQGIFYDKNPQKVLSMQDPYNDLSYCTVVATQYKNPNNRRTSVLENYNITNRLNVPYNELSYRDVTYYSLLF